MVAALATIAVAISVAAPAAAPPLTAPSVYLTVDYQARVVGQRAIGLGQAVDAGDVNGDGLPDALVSAPGRRSIVYVVYGRRGWRTTTAAGTLTPSRGYRIVTDADVQTLMPVGDGGDVNGDGVPDQLVGIPNGAGRVYVVYGQRRADAGAIDLDDLKPSEGYQIEGAPGDSAGTDVADAGDVNGDGVPDQLVGAPQGFEKPGRAYVVYGRRPGGPVDLAGLSPERGYRMEGAPFDEAGDSVRSAGDVNVDGVPDQLVGGMSDDHAYVVYGQRTPTAGTIELGVPGSWGYGMHGVPVTLTGASVANAGDVNDDGVPDALVGAPACEADAPPTATVYVVYGQRTPPQDVIDLANLSASLGYSVVDTRGACAGASVVGMPDLNGDGVPDQLIGAFGARWAGGDGAAYLVYGQRTSPQRVDLAQLQPDEGYAIGGLKAAETGWFVADAGDVDGDRAEDAWVWAPNYSATPTSTGAVYLVGPPQPAATPVSTGASLTLGRVAIRTACAALPGTRCSGTLALRGTGRRPPIYGSARFSLQANGSTAVSVPLTRSAVLRLRRTHRLTAEARAVTRRTAPAPSQTRVRRVVLRAG